MKDSPNSNPLPFTVRLNVRPPALTVEGVIEVMTGGGFKIVNGNACVVPPPGPGVKTCTVAADWKKITKSSAVNCVVKSELLTNVVAWSLPLTCIRDPRTKLLPFTVIVALLPRNAVFGETLVATGTGFDAGGASVQRREVPSEMVASLKLNNWPSVSDCWRPIVAAAPWS